MRLGMITNAFAGTPLPEILEWAARSGFEGVEIGPLVPLEEVRAGLPGRGGPPVVTNFLYCRNTQDPDRATAEHHRAALRERVRLAGEMGIPRVLVSTGVDPRATPAENLALAAEWLGELVGLAAEAGAGIALENCPDTGNIATNPDSWRALFDAVPDRRFGLAYDPSHLHRLGFDPVAWIAEFAPRIVHAHAKDTEVVTDPARAADGSHGFQRETTHPAAGPQREIWWRYRIPGLGQVEWRRFVAALKSAGYDGVLSVEHEDPLYEGTSEKVRQGLIKAREYLAPIAAGPAEIEEVSD